MELVELKSVCTGVMKERRANRDPGCYLGFTEMVRDLATHTYTPIPVTWAL